MKFYGILLLFVSGLIIGYFIPHNDDCIWNLWDDPRSCIISWDDGTFSYKSRITELGTIAPGEERVVKFATEHKLTPVNR